MISLLISEGHELLYAARKKILAFENDIIYEFEIYSDNSMIHLIRKEGENEIIFIIPKDALEELSPEFTIAYYTSSNTSSYVFLKASIYSYKKRFSIYATCVT